MKKTFEEPVLEVMMFQAETIMTESNWGDVDWEE